MVDFCLMGFPAELVNYIIVVVSHFMNSFINWLRLRICFLLAWDLPSFTKVCSPATTKLVRFVWIISFWHILFTNIPHRRLKPISIARKTFNSSKSVKIIYFALLGIKFANNSLVARIHQISSSISRTAMMASFETLRFFPIWYVLPGNSPTPSSFQLLTVWNLLILFDQSNFILILSTVWLNLVVSEKKEVAAFLREGVLII